MHIYANFKNINTLAYGQFINDLVLQHISCILIEKLNQNQINQYNQTIKPLKASIQGSWIRLGTHNAYTNI